jgi:DNA uptake protein ComE-like DNA-binding protein
MKRHARTIPARRAFATFLVIWVLAIAVVFVAAVQQSAFRQAASGREALARLRAAWAARAGVEAMMARLEYDTESPDLTDAFAVVDDMAEAAEGRVAGAAYLVSHTTDPGSRDPGDVYGPADAHAKVNINTMPSEALMLLPYMTQDVADAILDWIDDDDDVRPQGAEIGQYQSGPYPYEPRNAPLRSMAELELVAGVEPWYVRGEDWNLSNLLDPGEDDGRDSWPDDDKNGKLDAEWSQIVTASSAGDVLADSGKARLILDEASESDIAKRLDVDSTQARAIATLVAAGVPIPSLLASDLQSLMDAQSPPSGQNGGTRRQTRYRALTPEQLAALLAETVETAPDPAAPRPGKLNINTCPASMLEYIPGLDPALADSIVLELGARSKGFTSLVDLLGVPGMSRRRLAALVPYLTVRSNVYIVTSRGVDERTGIESEVVATIDRSSLPAVITEWRVR